MRNRYFTHHLERIGTRRILREKDPQRSFIPITSTVQPFQEGAVYAAGGQLLSAGMLSGEARSHRKSSFSPSCRKTSEEIKMNLLLSNCHLIGRTEITTPPQKSLKVPLVVTQ